MRKKCKPTINNEGGRNLFCAHYNDCLDHAVKKSWDSWNCSRCALRDKFSSQETPVLGFTGDVAYYELGDSLSGQDVESLMGV